MKYRKFGKTQDKSVSEIGLGCWQFSDDWGKMNDTDAFSIMQSAVDNGITFFDTADVYGMGRSEKLVGEFLKKNQDSLFVATKIGRRPDIYPDKYTLDNIEKQIDGCLFRLGLESLDLVQLHCIPTKIMEEGTVFDMLDKMVTKGKIQRYGASVESIDEALSCLSVPNLSSLQIIFNIFRQKPIQKILDVAAKKSVAIIVRVPLASGLLSGKFSKSTVFSDHDHRNYNRDGAMFNVGETFSGIEFEQGVELAGEIAELCPPDMTMAQFALRWILDFDQVTTVIPGASSPKQAAENATASSFPNISDDLHNKLSELYKQKIHQKIRGIY